MPDVRLLQASATALPAVRYKNDGALRRRLFTPESFAHPAKGHLGMWEDIIQRYTQPGETILDPMAGVGASLLAALMGRNVVCVELEQHFVSMLRANWEKARQHPMLGYSLGSVTIIHGDARNLSGLLADAVITSPPFQDVLQGKGDIEKYAGVSLHRKGQGYTRPSAIVSSPPYEGIETPPLGGSAARDSDRISRSHQEREGRHYGVGENIGNQRGGDLATLLVYNRLQYTDEVMVYLCQKCMSAPPSGGPRLEQPTTTSLNPSKQGLIAFAGRGEVPDGEVLLGISNDGQLLRETATPALNAVEQNAWLSIMSKVQRKLAENGITASATWLRSAVSATTIVTQGGCILCNASLAEQPSMPEVHISSIALRLRFVEPKLIRQSTTDGRRSNYWQEINKVYSQCYAVLKPGGVMALVVKGFTRDGKYVDLPTQTVELCESLGFTLFDRWARELWSLSFWRILQKRRDPAAFDNRLMFEEVLALRKPTDAVAREPNVGCVLTSPPYEGTASTDHDGIDWTQQADGRKKQEPHGVGSYGFSYTRSQEPKPMEVKRGD